MPTKYNRIYSEALSWGLSDSEAHAVSAQIDQMLRFQEDELDLNDVICNLHIALHGEGWKENDIADVEGLAMDIFDILSVRN